MKILHTSDWHLGHVLYGYDRVKEQQSMIDQIAKIVKDNLPDVFLISGDIYHVAQPSASSQKMFAEAMIQIHQANPAMTIVVTAGNHDSGSRHEAFSSLWQTLNIHVIGTLDKDMDGGLETKDKAIIEVPGKGFIIAVPFVSERYLPEGYFRDITAEVAKINTENLPIVLSAHLTVRGCDYKGHDDCTDFSVGGIDSIAIEDMGEGYDYLALGHIHRPQFIKGSHKKVRYSGTPIPISFDEDMPDPNRENHSVTIVTIEKHGDEPLFKFIDIENPCPLVTLPIGGIPAPFEEVKQQFKDFPSDRSAYIRLNVEVEDYLPASAKYEIESIAAEKECRFCLINSSRKKKAENGNRGMTVTEFQKSNPIDILHQYLKDKGYENCEVYDEMFHEAEKKLQIKSNDLTSEL